MLGIHVSFRECILLYQSTETELSPERVSSPLHLTWSSDMRLVFRVLKLVQDMSAINGDVSEQHLVNMAKVPRVLYTPRLIAQPFSKDNKAKLIIKRALNYSIQVFISTLHWCSIQRGGNLFHLFCRSRLVIDVASRESFDDPSWTKHTKIRAPLFSRPSGSEVFGVWYIWSCICWWYG